LTQADPIVVDARGHRCPVPTLRLQRAFANAATGQIVRLVADDPMARIDVPHFAAHHGYALLAMTEESGVLTFVVIKSL